MVPEGRRHGTRMFGLSAKPLSGRYLSFAEREEIALLRAQGHTKREVARRLGRAASTISRELRRNAATRGGGLEYRATTAQWHAERAARRQSNDWLASSLLQAGFPFPARRCPGKLVDMDRGKTGGGRTPGAREQIARRLPVDFPDDETMRISYEAIYQALFVQGRGALRHELTACLRTGRALRMPRARTRGRRQDLHLCRDHAQPTSGGGSRSRHAGPLGRGSHHGSW